MYIPKAFRVDDREQIHRFMHTYYFATLITQNDGTPWGTHVPILLDAGQGEYGTLVGHFARANPQRSMLAQGVEALVIFQGPHAYISPSWREIQEHDDAPTWDYAVVHAYGRPRLFEDERRLYDLLVRTIAYTERQHAQPWALKMSLDEARPQMRGIVGFEMEITRLEATFKLGQRRSQTDKERIYRQLMRRNDQQDRLLAEMMQTQIMG